MLEARINQGKLLKFIIEATKDLVTEANLQCTADGITLQAMDTSHVALVSLNLKAEGFDAYRCDRNVNLGVNLVSLGKILKCAGNDDSITLKAEEDADAVTFVFESSDGDRVSEFELKLMDIESEHLGIPETAYKCTVGMPSAEFQRIVRDMSSLGDTATISVANKGVKISVKGDLGTGSVLRKQNKASEKEEEHTTITLEEPTELTFALRFLSHITKATPLSSQVILQMSKDVPLLVEYKMDQLGNVRYYLAPKIDEEAT